LGKDFSSQRIGRNGSSGLPRIPSSTEENGRGQNILRNIIQLHPRLGILLDKAEFATVPDPLEAMILPGERIRDEGKANRTNDY